MRSALDSSLIFRIEDGQSDEDVADRLCDALSGGNITDLTIGTSGVIRTLPNCFFSGSSILTSLDLHSVTLAGNSTYPDPFQRLGLAMNASGTTLITISSSAITSQSGSVIDMDWDTLFNTFPILNRFSFVFCGVSGTLPARLPSTLIFFTLSYNSFSGSIPETLFENYASVTTPTTFTTILADEGFSGTIPASLVTSMPAGCRFSVSIGSKGITGTIPPNFLTLTHSSTITGIYVYFRFAGTPTATLPDDLWGLPSNMPALTSLSVDCFSSSLAGSLPPTWISQYSFPALTSAYFSLESNNITGSIHSGLFPGSAPMLTSYTLTLDGNPLNTTFDSSLLTSLIIPYTRSNAPQYVLSMIGCGLTGSLVLPTPPIISNLEYLSGLSINVASNALVSFTANTNTSRYLRSLGLAFNRNLQGTLENLLPSSSPSTLFHLDARNTRLNGTMPYMASVGSGIYELQLDSTSIDFCSGGSNRLKWTSSNLYSCSLLSTSAFSCASLYPTVCAVSAGCSDSTKPSEEFVCENSVWVSNGPITTPSFSIPLGAANVVINGDVESSDIAFNGLGTTLTINGCANNLSTIGLSVNPNQLKGVGKKITQQLVSITNANCAINPLDSVVLESRVSGSSCRSMKSTKSVSSGTLSGILSIDASRCNTWWIILASVIAGVVVIGVIIVILLVVLVPKVRYALIPHSRIRDSKRASRRSQRG